MLNPPMDFCFVLPRPADQPPAALIACMGHYQALAETQESQDEPDTLRHPV